MTSWGVATRLARREVIRRPWRTLIVMMLVIAPVLVLTSFGVMVRTTDRTSAERFASNWGGADFVVRGSMSDYERWRDVSDSDFNSDGSVSTADSQLYTLLEENSTGLEFRNWWFRIRDGQGQRSWAVVTDLPVDDPMVSGVTGDLSGRLPSGTDEVVLSASLAKALHLGVGDRLELTRPQPFSAEVVGTINWNGDLSRRAILVDSARGAEVMAEMLGENIEPNLITLIRWNGPRFDDDTPKIADPDLFSLVSSGPFERPYYHFEEVSVAQETIVWSWMGGALAFTIVGVVIAAAFAVTARRQLLLIGQLMGNGASVGTLRAALFLQGTVIGLVGGVIGVALALGGLHLFQPLVERAVNYRLNGYDVHLFDLLPIVVLATLAATGAALIPARVALRTSVLQALSGRRPVGPYPAKLVARGGIAVAAGLVLLAVATVGAQGLNGGNDSGLWLFVVTGVVGALGVILGTCAVSPAIVGKLEPLASHLRGTARLAARSIARQRTRTGAVVAAVAVVAAGAVAASTTWLTIDARDGQRYDSSLPANQVVVSSSQELPFDDTDAEAWAPSIPVEVPDEVLEEITTVVPDATVLRLEQAWIPGVGNGDHEADQRLWLFKADGDFTQEWNWQAVPVLDAETAKELGLSTEAQEGLARTGYIISPDMFGVGLGAGDSKEAQDVSVSVYDEAGNKRDEFEVTILSHPLPDSPDEYASPSMARRLNLEFRPFQTVFVAPEPIDDDQADALIDLQEDLWGDSSGLSSWISYQVPRWEPPEGLITSAIVAVATLFSLGVVALGLALSAAETKDERDVLVAIGARPRTMGRLAGAKAAVLSASGTLIGVPLGFIPTFVVAKAAMSNGMSFKVVFPWFQVVLLVIVVPLVATVATQVASGISLRLRPVQASNMAFD